MNRMLPPLNLSYIFSKVSQEEIFSRFLNISLTVIYTCLNSNHLICSPLRKDNNPTMGFYYNSKGKIFVRDFNGHFHGDCLDVVAHVTPGIHSTNGQDFYNVLHTIAKEFNIHRYVITRSSTEREPVVFNTTSQKKAIFNISPRDFNSYDFNYWYKYHLNEAILTKFDVVCVQEFYINDYCIYQYRKTDPAYAYFLGYDDTGRELWKVYFPMRTKKIKNRPKFYSNNASIQGGKFIKKHEHGVVIKSYKDVMALSLFEDDFDIQGISTSGESKILTPEQFKYTRKFWNNISTWSDYDLTGILHGLKMNRYYNTKYYFLTNGRYKTVDFGAKDLTDYIAINGLDKTKRLIEYILNHSYSHLRSERFKIDMSTYFNHQTYDAVIDDDIPF